MFRFQAMNLECAISNRHEIIIHIGISITIEQNDTGEKKTLFHFQSFVHNVVQFVSTNALIGKIQDINKYVLCKQSFVGVSVQ